MSAWVFGKLPAHGDFVARGMEADDHTAFDDWLSTALVAARERYPDDFTDRFDVAQPWQGMGDGVAAALAASQDAAGRRYPVVLLIDGATHDAAACEELLRAAIVEGWAIDRLAAAAPAPRGHVSQWLGPDGQVLAGERPAGLLCGMLA